MKRGTTQPSDEPQRSKCPTQNCRNKHSMYQKAGLATSGVRVVTRSKARAAAEAALDSRHRCPESIESQISQQQTLLPTAAVTRAGQRATSHGLTATQATTHLPTALTGRASATTVSQQHSKSLVGCLHQQHPDDLRQLDVTFASSTFIHPSLLQHAGKSTSKRTTTQQAQGKAAKQSPARNRASTPQHHVDQDHVQLQPDAAGQVSIRGQQHKARMRVMFAPGPFDPKQQTNCTPDGHPAAEGVPAVPVRRVSPSYALDLTKGNVLFLENLLGQDCQMSVARLKRRVGLLPPIKPFRPYVGTRPGWQGEGEAADQQTSAAATAELQAVTN